MSPLEPLARLLLASFKTFCVVAIVLAMLWTTLTIGPHLEARYFPVASRLQITAMEDTGRGTTRVWASFTKLRDCEFLGLSWYRGSRAGGFERVHVALQPRPDGDLSGLTRPLGWQFAGPWEVGMPANEIPDGSFARLAHRCHIFWVSMTEFYP